MCSRQQYRWHRSLASGQARPSGVRANRENDLGNHLLPDVAESFNNRARSYPLASAVATLCRVDPSQGKYDEADQLYVRAIAIGENALGPEHPDPAAWLNNRAGAVLRRR